MKKAIALASVAALLAFASAATYVVARSSRVSGEKSIEIVARRFDYMPSQLTLKKGTPVVLELTSNDVPMGFNLPDFDLRADMLPGTITRVRLVPDKTGTFVFYCDVFCGGGHEEMQGVITVVD
jgi:cytochrome c oxidase subunit 2